MEEVINLEDYFAYNQISKIILHTTWLLVFAHRAGCSYWLAALTVKVNVGEYEMSLM